MKVRALHLEVPSGRMGRHAKEKATLASRVQLPSNWRADSAASQDAQKQAAIAVKTLDAACPSEAGGGLEICIIKAILVMALEGRRACTAQKRKSLHANRRAKRVCSAVRRRVEGSSCVGGRCSGSADRTRICNSNRADSQSALAGPKAGSCRAAAWQCTALRRRVETRRLAAVLNACMART